VVVPPGVACKLAAPEAPPPRQCAYPRRYGFSAFEQGAVVWLRAVIRLGSGHSLCCSSGTKKIGTPSRVSAVCFVKFNGL
jgi:hypothetical protein